MRIRKADLHDLAAIKAIEDACFAGSPEHCSLDDYANALTDLNSQVFVIGRPAVASGMIVLSGAHSEITNLAVLPAHRGKSLGRQLMHKMMAVAGCSCIYLDVRKKNPAVQLYRSLGFSVVSQTAGWYVMKW